MVRVKWNRGTWKKVVKNGFKQRSNKIRLAYLKDNSVENIQGKGLRIVMGIQSHCSGEI